MFSWRLAVKASAGTQSRGSNYARKDVTNANAQTSSSTGDPRVQICKDPEHTRGGTRTRKVLPPGDFESPASTKFRHSGLSLNLTVREKPLNGARLQRGAVLRLVAAGADALV